MTGYRFATLTCDGSLLLDSLNPEGGKPFPYQCGEIFDPGMALTVKEARKLAAAAGWQFTEGQDLCPKKHLPSDDRTL